MKLLSINCTELHRLILYRNGCSRTWKVCITNSTGGSFFLFFRVSFPFKKFGFAAAIQRLMVAEMTRKSFLNRFQFARQTTSVQSFSYISLYFRSLMWSTSLDNNFLFHFRCAHSLAAKIPCPFNIGDRFLIVTLGKSFNSPIDVFLSLRI
jgi:hypothetical protein